MTPPAATPLTMSTDQLAPKDRLPYWREVFGRAMMRFDIEPIGDAPFRCAATMQVLPGLSLAALTTSDLRIRRTRDLTSDGRSDLVLNIPREGTAFLSHLGRDISVAEGGGTLCACSEPGTLTVRSQTRFNLIAVPADTLAPLLHDRDAAVARPISPNAGALRLLSGYVDMLLQGQAFDSPELQHSAAAHVRDLIALAVGATRDAAHLAAGRGARAARLAAIRSDILANLSQVRLSPKLIARRHGITERYVHLLFEQSGETFGAFVTRARLERARELLLGAPAALKIGDIARRVGYGELTTFNRAFRRRFGDTPSGLRVRRGNGS